MYLEEGKTTRNTGDESTFYVCDLGYSFGVCLSINVLEEVNDS